MFKKLLFVFLATSTAISTVSAQTFPTDSWRDVADTSWHNETDLTFDITTAEALAGISVLVEGGETFEGIIINIDADINLDTKLWVPIGKNVSLPFSGTVTGNGNTISNLWIDGISGDFIGLFGQAFGASFSDLNLDTANVNGSGDSSAAMVGNLSSFSTMHNCHVSNAEVNIAGTTIGGLVGGLLIDSYITNSSFKGQVTGETQVGGIAGSIWDKSGMTECFSEGSVSGEHVIGGLIGFSTLTIFPERESFIIDSYSRADVSALFAHAGGLVGYGQANLYLSNSYSTGLVTGTENVGGVMGTAGFIHLINNYFDNETSGTTEGVGVLEGVPFTLEVTGKSTEDMKSSDLVDLLNASRTDGPWAIDANKNDGYPFLGNTLSVVDNIKINENIAVYPTMVDYNFTIESTTELSTYNIYTMTGTLIQQGKMNGTTTLVNVEALSSGVYIVQVRGANTTVSHRIIKK